MADSIYSPPEAQPSQNSSLFPWKKILFSVVLVVSILAVLSGLFFFADYKGQKLLDDVANRIQLTPSQYRSTIQAKRAIFQSQLSLLEKKQTQSAEIEQRKRTLASQIKYIDEDLADIQTAYQEMLSLLVYGIRDMLLDIALHDKQETQDAINDLHYGKTQKAEALLAKRARSSTLSAEQKADLAFQRGRLKTFSYDFQAAYDYIEKAARLQPDSAFYQRAMHEAAERAALNQPQDVFQDSAQFIESQMELAQSYNDMDQFHKALQVLQDVEAKAKHALTQVNDTTADFEQTIAAAYFNVDKYDQSIAHFEKALTLKQSLYRAEHPTLLQLQTNFVGALAIANQYDKAIELGSRTLKSIQNTNPELLDTILLLHLANSHAFSNDIDTAIDFYHKTLSHNDKHQSLTPMQVINIRFNLALANFESGKFDVAINHLKEIDEQTLQTHNPAMIVEVYNHIGYSYGKMQQFQQSAVYLNKSLNYLLSDEKTSPSSILSAKLELAQYYNLADQYQKSIRLLEQAINEGLAHFKPTHLGIIESQLTLTDALKAEGRLQETIKLAQVIISSLNANTQNTEQKQLLLGWAKELQAELNNP